MDNFIELMDLTEDYVETVINDLRRRLREREYVQDDPEVVMLTTALTKNLGLDNPGDHPTVVLVIAARGDAGVMDRPTAHACAP